MDEFIKSVILLFMRIFRVCFKVMNIRWKYLLCGSVVYVCHGAKLKIDKNVSIWRSKITVSSNSILRIGMHSKINNSSITTNVNTKLEIGDSNSLNRFSIFAKSGSGFIGNSNIFTATDNGYPPQIIIDGCLKIGAFNRFCCVIWMRFGSKLVIGDRNTINQRSELRVDNSVTIGDYNQISYDCVIWDTNTHNIYQAGRRREMTNSQYPSFGVEIERPLTNPVYIGSDCWIARGVSILKGVRIADRCIVAFNTTLVNGNFSENSTIFGSVNIQVRDNNI